MIQVQNKDKAKLLVELLSALDFVDSIEVTEAPMEREESNGHTQDDFFALAGIWQDRDISQDTLRSKAWPQQET